MTDEKRDEQEFMDDEGSFAAFMSQAQEPEKESPPEADSADDGERDGLEGDQPDDQPGEPFEGYSSLPDEVRQKFDQLQEERAHWEQRWRSQHGQLAPMQRKANQLQQEHKLLSEQLEAERRRAAELERSSSDFAKKLAKYRESFPEEAEVVEGMVGPLREQIEQSAKAQAELKAAVEAAQQRAYIAEQRAELTVRHPDWRDHVQSDVFREWVPHAPPELRAKLESLSAADNIEVMDAFKRDLDAAMKWAQQQQQPKPGNRPQRPGRSDVPPTSRRQSGLALPNGQQFADEDEASFAAFMAANA